MAIARGLVGGKIRNCRTLLRRNARENVERVLSSLQRLAEQAVAAETVATLLGIEGAAARLYFSKWPTMVREDLRFPGSRSASRVGSDVPRPTL